MCEALTRLADTRRQAVLRVYVNAPSYDDLEHRVLIDATEDEAPTEGVR